MKFRVKKTNPTLMMNALGKAERVTRGKTSNLPMQTESIKLPQYSSKRIISFIAKMESLSRYQNRCAIRSAEEEAEASGRPCP